MDRLTYQHGGNHAVPAKFDFDFFLRVDERTADGITKILDKLAAYEDAEEQGLLVRLMCKVNETVFVIHDAEVEYGGKAVILDCTVSEVSTHRIWIENNSNVFNHSDIGETVFLTREAAEATLTKCTQIWTRIPNQKTDEIKEQLGQNAK